MSLFGCSNVQLPSIEIPAHHTSENILTDNDMVMIKSYLNSLAEIYVNKDNKIWSNFDDKNATLSLKIGTLRSEVQIYTLVRQVEDLKHTVSDRDNQLYKVKRDFEAGEKRNRKLEAKLVVNDNRLSVLKCKSEGLEPGLQQHQQQHHSISLGSSTAVTSNAATSGTATGTAPNNMSPIFATHQQHQPHHRQDEQQVQQELEQQQLQQQIKQLQQRQQQLQLQQPTSTMIGYSNHMSLAGDTSSSGGTRSVGVVGVNTLSASADINPERLIYFADLILYTKGPLPVGEVGKMLQEQTGNVDQSQMLKEKHNGLKKFLEKYPNKFIMSNDHPFNPHVYLKRMFSLEEQNKIINGSQEILEEFKKARVSVGTFAHDYYCYYYYCTTVLSMCSICEYISC